MIETVNAAFTATVVRGVTLIHAARRAHAVILAGDVPSVPITAPPGSSKVLTIIGWIGWGVFASAVAGVLLICIKMAINSHRNRGGEGGGEEAGKLFWPLLACIVGSSAGAILGVVA